ncbi:RNA polymerase sigma factor [Nonomuraea sp. NPDC050022]|uniref:RNA polymerase sigma factor n=1 Tax=Nonomuraea sp. NPDC050022 TaxID=3364358 RepID=UPI003789CC0F
MGRAGAGQAVAAAHRREWAFVLAATVRVAQDLDLAEECVQEAYAAALSAWERDGIPANPAAWLTTTAKRRAMDAIRRERTFRSKLPLLVESEELAPHRLADRDEADAVELEDAVPDERLRLIFTCCHPALAQEARLALTLRLVCGLPTPDVARALLVSEQTMAARITRAKKKISVARIPYRVPRPAELPDRLAAVLGVLHLLVTDARRATRTGADGRLLRLEEQDRSLWDRGALAEAHELIVAGPRGGRAGRYLLQAAIALLYAQAPSYEQTDWPQIVALYDRLLALWPSPVVALNRTVPVSMLHGPALALTLVEALEQDGRLSRYQYLPAIKADLLRRLGRTDEAATAYRQALELTDNEVERAFLAGRLTDHDPGTTSPAVPSSRRSSSYSIGRPSRRAAYSPAAPPCAASSAHAACHSS